MNDTSRLSAHDPDGVPHEIIGLTWLVSLGVAVSSFAALAIGGAVAVIALAFIPALVFALDRRAQRQRDTESQAK